MARPTKQGIDYFPIDCQFDDKIEMYLIEKGATGLGVLVTLWQMIYSNEGYYIGNNIDLHLLIKRKIDVDVNEVSDCINVCLRRNIFDSEKHEEHEILTSKAIQKRFFDAAKKKKTVAVIEDYVINSVNSGGNWVYVCGNATNVNVDVKVNKKINKKNPETEKPVSASLDDEGKKPKPSPVLLKTYLDECDQAGTKPIPPDDKIFDYESEINLPDGYLGLCWTVFKDDYTNPDKTGKKKYTDWKAHFRNYVRKNYHKLWWLNPHGKYQLTTVGMQAAREHGINV